MVTWRLSRPESIVGYRLPFPYQTLNHSSLPLSPLCAFVRSRVIVILIGFRLVVYGGDDQTTNEIGGLGDLWVYSPKTSRPHAGRAGASMMDEWKVRVDGVNVLRTVLICRTESRDGCVLLDLVLLAGMRWKKGIDSL